MGEQEADFSRYCAMKDMAPLPTNRRSAILFVISHFFLSFGFWAAVAIFFLYPPIQFWLAFFIACWFLYMLCFSPFCFITVLHTFQTPAAMLLILAWIVGFLLQLLFFSANRTVPWSNVYVSFFVFIKLLQSFRAMTLNAVVLGAYQKHKTSIEEKPKDKQRRNAFIVYYIILVNQIFLVSLLRSTFALVWGFYSFLVALLMRPLWANLFLFGRFTGIEPVIMVDMPTQEVKELNFEDLQEKYFKKYKILSK